MNRYISKYSKFDTHFNRNDQWKHVAWDDEPETPLWIKTLSSIGIAAILILLMVI